MTIVAGSRLGPYEIVSPLGAGGMGEVWKALDPRIGREVAIKILHPAMSDNAELVRRFEQEARTVGQMNHPNLIAVYDVGEEGEIAYLVTELLEGDTLRERLSGGALPMRRAIEWGSGIASGLAAAHEKGIVHRDLKPENIFVTKDNRVKILDFGLARLTNVGFSDSGRTDAPTDQRTDPGKVMGTVGYMSPEQVRALPVDHRSDIFSFGAILYEMLTGIRAFRRESSIETMNAILKEEPPELTSTNPNLHPGLERIVRHCLEKHPEARFQSAKDMAFDLESLSATSGSVPSIVAAAARRRSLLPMALALAAILLAAGGYWAGRESRPAEPAASASAPALEGFQRLTFRRGNVLHAQFAPDGQSVVYSAAWDGKPAEIFTVRLDDRISRPLGIERADVLSVSSKGELAVLLKDRLVLTTSGLGTLARVPLGGGMPRQILEGVFAACWGPDGEKIAVARYDQASDRNIIEYPIGTEIRTSSNFLTVEGISPDGSRIVFSEQGQDGTDVRVASTSGTIDTVFVARNYLGPVRWVSNDLLTFQTGPGHANTVHLVGVDGSDRTLAEMPGFEILDVTPRGDLVLEREIYRSELIYGSDHLKNGRDLSWLDLGKSPWISANDRVLFTEVGESGGANGIMYMRDVEGSPPVMLGEGFGNAISSDGTQVVATRADRPTSLFVIPTGAGSTREIKPEGARLVLAGGFVRHDRQVLVLATLEDGTRGPFIHDLVSSKTTRLAMEDEFSAGLAISPDGERFAFRRGDGKIVIQGLDGGASTVVAGSGEKDYPIQWSADGKRLWVVDFQASVPRPVWTIDLETGKRTLWKNLAPENLTGVIRVDDPWVAPDGKSWAYASVLVTDSDLYTARLTGLK